MLEIVPPDLDVLPVCGVEDGANSVEAEERRVELDVGVEALVLDEVEADALDFVGRAAVHRGKGDRMYGRGGKGRHEGVGLVDRLAPEGLDEGRAIHEGGEIAHRAFPEFALGRLPHALDVVVDLLPLDAREAVAHGHVEEEIRGLGREEGREEVHRDPSGEVFLAGLDERELRGPLGVVPLVERVDAGLGYVEAVVLLDGLELKDAGAREIGGDEVRRYLRMGAGRGSDGKARPAAHHGEPRALRLEREVLLEGLGRYLVDRVLRLVLPGYPLEERLKRGASHNLTHRYPQVRNFP